MKLHDGTPSERTPMTGSEQRIAHAVARHLEGETAADALHAMLAALCALLEAAYPNPSIRIEKAADFGCALIDMLTEPPTVHSTTGG